MIRYTLRPKRGTQKALDKTEQRELEVRKKIFCFMWKIRSSEEE